MPKEPVLQSNNERNEIKEIESLIETFRPAPSKKFYQWAAQEGWKGQADTPRWSVGDFFQRRVVRLVGVLSSYCTSLRIVLIHILGSKLCSINIKFFPSCPILRPNGNSFYNSYPFA